MLVASQQYRIHTTQYIPSFSWVSKTLKSKVCVPLQLYVRQKEEKKRARTPPVRYYFRKTYCLQRRRKFRAPGGARAGPNESSDRANSNCIVISVENPIR